MKKKKNIVINEDDSDIDIIIKNNKIEEKTEVKEEIKKDKKKNKTNKRNSLVPILFIGILILIIILIFFLINYLSKRNESYSIKKEISNYSELINNTNTMNKEIEEELNKIKEESKSKVEEYDIWEYLKEKINKALA